VLFRAGGDIIGGYWGAQDTEGRYAMIVTIVREDWRRHGVYSELLPRVVEAARESGFREIYSRHRADNNAILIPKLRAGFVIAGFEIAPRWGLTVHLRMYLVEAMRLLHEHRVDGEHAAELRTRGLPLA
jgi:GNAT superfamily N-acetyltransferase